jgi:hypothetical protein
MPIRRATISGAPTNEVASWLVSVVLIGVMVGLAVGFGDRNPPTPTEFQPIQVPTFEPPVFDPATFEALEQLQFESPLATVSLGYELHEIHISQVVDGELFATGLILASDPYPLEDIRLEVIIHDPGGAPRSIPSAVVSCKTMQPRERCAWMIEADVQGSLENFEFQPRGQRSLQLGPPQLDLRSEREGEIEFNPKKRTVKFVTRDRSFRDGWATVTAFSAEERVLGVAETRFAGHHRPGRHRFEVAVPKLPDVVVDEVARYEVRVGGQLLDW